MRRLTLAQRVLLVTAFVIGGMAAVAGAAGSGIITSCVNKSTGALRIIGAGRSCKATGVKLAWNAQGPPGPAGPTGVQGPPGPRGPQGASGISVGDSVNAGSASLNNCSATVIISKTIAVTTPVRIDVTGAGSYSPGTTNLLTGNLQVVLRDALDTQTLASAPSAQGTAPFNEGSATFSTYIASTGVLQQGSDPTSPGTAYIANPGTYILQLVGSAADGTCTGSPLLLNPGLTYLLIGSTQ